MSVFKQIMWCTDFCEQSA